MYSHIFSIPKICKDEILKFGLLWCIGGRPLGKSTYIIDFATEKWTEGPPMDYDRYLHQVFLVP